MFSKKIETDYSTYTQADVAKAPLPARASAVLSPMAIADAPNATYSIINEWMVMRGDLESEADILVKGRIFGNVKCKMLIIDSGALIEGGIDVEEIIVRGAAKGIMIAKKVRFEKTADVDCEIHHQSFSAEEGARIKGALRFSDEPTRLTVRGVATDGAEHISDATH